jgi:AraC-like DNA-binding protein
MKTLTEKLVSTKRGFRLYRQERAILEVTELICKIMAEQNVSRLELARRLGKTKDYVTRLLNGRVGMTVRMISDVFVALDRILCFHTEISGCPIEGLK